VAGGGSVTLTTTVPGENARLTFAGTAGQRISLRIASCCVTKISILSPDGTALVAATSFGAGTGFVDTRTLPATGTYTIVVDPQGDATGDMTLTLYDVPPDATGTIAAGGAATVTTTTPGQNVRLTFSGTAGDGVKLALGPFNCCSTRVSILNPDGTTLVAPTAFNPDGGSVFARLPATGTYVVFVDPQGPNVGSVHLRLELDNTPPAVPILTLTESSLASHVVGTSFFYRPSGGGGTFAVGATTSDGVSGIQKVRFPGLGGGFTPTAFTDDLASPYSQTYSWTSGATYDGSMNPVAVYDRVGNISTATFAVTRDADPPVTTDDSAAIGSSWKNASQTVSLTPSDALAGVAATHYTIDGSTPTTASPLGTAVSLTAEGVWTVKYLSVDNVGNQESAKTAGTQIRIDKTRPSTATLNALPSVIRTGQVLSGSGADALSGVASISYYYCAGGNCTPSTLIGSSSTGPSYSVTWSSQPADGTYQLLARVFDVAGNSLDSAKRTVTIDNTPPNTTITASPANPTNSTSASFSFASTEAGSSFQCRLDGGAFASCTSPRAYSGLAAGSHTFEVRATDPVGNTDATPATHTWTIDLTAPDTTITATPANPTNATGASFSFTSTEAGSSFQCSLDGAAFASCTSPRSYTGLADGSHTFQVRATDPAGNTDATPASYTWTIDATAPNTTITASPANPTNATSATFSFTSTESGSTFQCRLDGAAFASCTSPQAYSGLAAGSHTFEVRATDSLGNTDPTPATHTWTVDLTAPNTTITASPPNPSNSTSPSFSYSSSEAGSTFQCALDGGVFSSCTSPRSYSGLAAGSHTFEVRATDPAGNTDATPASYTWTIDLTAPETTITSGPSDPTNSTSASFSFSSTEAGSTFQCSLDGGAYASCTSPKSYGGLAAGSHTFQVRAIDPAGNTDATPATSTWTVDVAAPNTSLTSNPANPTNQTSASFSFTSTEAGSSFQCALDGAPFSVCSSPADYTLLGEGSHTFEVKATDTAGNPDATPATYTWTVDLTAPNTTITASPANPSNSTSPSFSFTSTEAGSSFQCALDAGVFSSCASPKSYSALAAGSHTFEVRATDPAGNTDATSASYTWTVDVTAPETTITASPANPTNSTSASFGFTSSKAGSTFECRLDGAAFASCTSPRAYSGLAAGPHTFEVRATDTAGNTDATPASHAWTIDLAAPNTTVTASPANPTNATSATFSFTSTESGSSFQCALDGAPFSVCISPADYTLLGEGAHTFEVKATDPAGNTDPTPATYAWTVDLTAPETTITGSPPDPTNSATATFSFTSTQAGSSFACSLDGGAYAACTSPRTYTVLPAGSHSFEVKATDPAGNTDPTPASYTWTIDVTEPETSITSGPANPTNATSASFEFAADKAGSTFECALDGAAFAPCTSPKGYSGLAAGLHTFQVRATDVAGNTDATPATYSWRVDLTPPETTITSGPADPTSSTNASFQFSSSETGSTFECSLDGSAYEACASPKSYTGLAAGPHTFRVRATDAAGNVDASPPSASWRIDVAVPDTSILSGPASLTNSTSATFDFASTETGSTFECSLDGAAYAACESPKTYPALAAGSHSFDVRATDPAGNTDPTPAGRTWTIDVSAPPAPVIESPAEGSPSATGNFTLSGTAEAGSIVEVFDGATSKGTTTAASDGSWSKALLGVADGSHTYTATATDAAGNTSPASNARTIVVDTSPPNTTIDADPPPYQASTTAFFTFSADDPAATFECSLDGAAFAPCTSPKTYNGLSEGPHSVQVRATDSAGNTDPSPATSSWTVDLTAPAAPVIGSPADGTTNTTGTIAFSGTAEPGSFVELYDGATRLLGAATTNSSGNWSKTLTNVADGSHTYTATATDAAGNTSPASAAVTVTVDATAPNTSISASPANPTSSTSASFEFAATETGSSFECSLDGGAYEACASPKSYTGLGAGSHAFAVRATDASGNTDATPASYAWTIDVSAPETTITSSPADPTTETTAGFEFTSSEPGSTFECSLDGAAFAACTSPATYSGLAPGAHTFEVRATDQAGNTDATPATHGWTVT